MLQLIEEPVELLNFDLGRVCVEFAEKVDVTPEYIRAYCVGTWGLLPPFEKPPLTTNGNTQTGKMLLRH